MLCFNVLPVGSLIAPGVTSSVPILSVANNGADVDFCTAGQYAFSQVSAMSVTDGVQLGWMVGGIWLSVFALLFITRAFRSYDKDSEYGNS